LLPAARQKMHDEEAGQGANRARQQQVANKIRQEEEIVGPVCLHLNAVRKQERRSEEEEGPAAEEHRLLKLVSEDLVGSSRRAEEKRCFRRAKHAAVEEQRRRKDHQSHKRKEKEAEQQLDDVQADWHLRLQVPQEAKALLKHGIQAAPNNEGQKHNQQKPQATLAKENVNRVMKEPPPQPKEKLRLRDRRS